RRAASRPSLSLYYTVLCQARCLVNQTIAVTRTAASKPKPNESELGFGTVFTDHMAVMTYQEGRGWHDLRIAPYGPLTLDPAAAVLHYAQAVFDGLKAFRGQDGMVRLFRPEHHVKRLQASAIRLCIPPIDEDQVLNTLLALVELEQDWVPRTIGPALYIRR